MLVLTRKTRERVVVFDPDSGEELLTLHVLEIEGGRVRLGFETVGPKLPIYREEVLNRTGGVPKPLLR